MGPVGLLRGGHSRGAFVQLGEAGMGFPQVQGREGLKGDCVEVLENTETMKMSGNRCKRYRASVNII